MDTGARGSYYGTTETTTTTTTTTETLPWTMEKRVTCASFGSERLETCHPLRADTTGAGADTDADADVGTDLL
jgi:hypothetical protein